jgi:hypothetical protein
VTSSEASPALATRLAEVMALIESARPPLVALAAHGRAPARFPISRLLDAAPVAESAEEGLQRAGRLLAPLAENSGETTEKQRTPEDFSLADLSALENVKPDLETLRTLLGQALTVAERIDEARGRSYPEPVGGSCGWDFAEEVNQLLARVQLEGAGARGKGLE